MVPSVVHRTIGTTPYVFEKNRQGWGVVANSSPTDRFYRSYQVYCSPSGVPLRCSCPSCVDGGKWCKHLREVERMHEEEKQREAKDRAALQSGEGRYHLDHPSKDRHYRFSLSDRLGPVLVEKTEENKVTERRTLPLDAARSLWKFLITKAGYRRW